MPILLKNSAEFTGEAMIEIMSLSLKTKITGGNAHLVSALYRTYEDTVFIALCYFHDSGLVQIKFWF